jgi:hypothetical protein
MVLEGHTMDMRLFKMILILLFSVSAWAGPLDSSDVSSSARWVIHVDAQAFWASQFGTQIKQVVDSNDVRAKIDAMKQLFGSDVTADIHSVTLYGADGDDKRAVALVKGKMNPKKLISMAVLTPRYEKIQVGELQIHKWGGDDGKQKIQYMGFVSDHTLVLSQTRSTVEKALDVLAGKADSVEGTERFKALNRAPDNAFVVVCAEELADITKGQAHAAMLQRSSMMAFIMGEKNGFLNTTLQLETESSESAGQIEAMGRGILAMVQFQETKIPQAKSLVQACSLKSENKTVEFSFRYPVEKLIAILKPHIQKLKGQD